jgi:hypothetical protein
LSTTKHHSSSFSGFRASTKEVLGNEPIAIKIHSAFNSFPDFSFTQVIQRVSQTISSTSSFKIISIFSFFFACSSQIFSALKT